LISGASIETVGQSVLMVEGYPVDAAGRHGISREVEKSLGARL